MMVSQRCTFWKILLHLELVRNGTRMSEITSSRNFFQANAFCIFPSLLFSGDDLCEPCCWHPMAMTVLMGIFSFVAPS